MSSQSSEITAATEQVQGAQTDKTHNVVAEPRAAKDVKSSKMAEEPRQTWNATSTIPTIRKTESAPPSGMRQSALNGDRPATTISRAAKGDASANRATEKSLPKQESSVKKPKVKITKAVGVGAVFNAKPNIKMKKRPLNPTQSTSRTSVIQRLNGKREPEPIINSDFDDFEDEIAPIRHQTRTAGMHGVAMPAKKKTAAKAEPSQHQNELDDASQSGEASRTPQCKLTNEEVRLLVKPGITLTTKSQHIVQTAASPGGMILFKTQPAPPEVGDVPKTTVDNKQTAKKQSDDKVADNDSGVVTTKGSQHSAPGPQGPNSQTAPNHGNVKASGGGSVPRDHARRPEPQATHKRKRGLDDDFPPFKRIAG